MGNIISSSETLQPVITPETPPANNLEVQPVITLETPPANNLEVQPANNLEVQPVVPQKTTQQEIHLETLKLLLEKAADNNIVDVKKLFISMNVKLRYVESETTTEHIFKAVSNNDKTVAFVVKVCAKPKNNNQKNEQLEMIKLMNDFVINKRTPHVVLLMGSFNTNISNFIKIPNRIIDLNDSKNAMYKKFIDAYNNGELEDHASVYVSEWCNGGDLLTFIRKNYTKMTLKQWIVMIFQILFTLARIHETYPNFRFNNMSANNILLKITNFEYARHHRYVYNMNNTKFFIPNTNIQTKICNFNSACIDNNIENKYYDMYYFLNTLTDKENFPHFYDGSVPKEIVDFVHRVIPEEYRNDNTNVDTEYMTPYAVIMHDPLFEKYRFNC